MNLVGMLGKMLLSNAMRGGRGNGNLLGSLLGGALGGGAPAGGGGGGGLGGLLAGLAGGGAGGGAAGASLGGLLGQLGGSGGAAGGGGIGSLLGGMLGGTPSSGGGLGSLLGAAMGQQRPDGGIAQQAPSADPEQEQQAELLVRAMINAAKADGAVDDAERDRIVGKLGEVDEQELAFVRREMAAPLDVDAFARSVPQGLEQQVYLVSLLAIDLDNQAEARYLDALCKGLGIDQAVANQLHEEVGAPALYP